VQLNEVITLTRNQLAALLGAGPDRGLALSRPTAGTLEAMALPSAVPAELLGRRPDLIAQINYSSQSVMVRDPNFSLVC